MLEKLENKKRLEFDFGKGTLISGHNAFKLLDGNMHEQIIFFIINVVLDNITFSKGPLDLMQCYTGL